MAKINFCLEGKPGLILKGDVEGDPFYRPLCGLHYIYRARNGKDIRLDIIRGSPACNWAPKLNGQRNFNAQCEGPAVTFA